MKDATQVTAAIEIVGALRNALAAAMDERKETQWDTQVLVYESARLLALVLRNEDVTPSQLEDVVRFLRQVYAGVFGTGLMSVEQAVEEFCSGPSLEADGSDGTAPAVLH